MTTIIQNDCSNIRDRIKNQSQKNNINRRLNLLYITIVFLRELGINNLLISDTKRTEKIFPNYFQR